MNQSTTPCRPEVLRSFVEESMSAVEQVAMERHLDECPACRAALDELVASFDRWQDARLYLATPTESDSERPVASYECYRRLLGPTDDPRMMGRVGRYEISGILGAGGMGVVFKGFDASLNRFVAIKMLSPLFCGSGVARQRFLREAQSAAAVIHDNVIAIHAIDEWQGSPYLVMTYVRGESLRNRLQRRGPLSTREVLRVGMQIASGLAAAHSQGLIHRDIKPANILLESDVDRLKILDFGLARAVDDIRLTKSDMLLGTPQYMSPEQARDEPLDYRTDLFSLGSLLYEAATGRSPFYGSTSYGVLRRIIECRPLAIRQINADVPEWLERLIGKLMEKERGARFAAANEVEVLLRQCLAHIEQPLLVSLPDELTPPEPVRHRYLVSKGRLFMSLSALAVAFVGGTLLFNQPESGNRERRSDDSGEKAVSTQAEAKSDQLPSTKAGNFRITVVGTGSVEGMEMSTEFDLSRLKVNQQFNSFGKSANGNSVGGAGGGAGGGFGGKFFKPNFGIALKIEPLESGKDQILRIGSKAKGTDDLGTTIDSSDRGPAVSHFGEFEAKHPGTESLYLYLPSREGSKLTRLQGELLVTPGKRLAVTFDETTKQTKTADKAAFTLESVSERTGEIEVVVEFPQTKGVREARNPQERFQSMVANRGSSTAVIEDSEGVFHRPSSATSGGGAVSTSFTSNGGAAQGSVTSADASTQTFKFSPLPEGRTIKAIHATFEDRTGEPKRVPFTLEDVPLK